MPLGYKGETGKNCVICSHPHVPQRGFFVMPYQEPEIANVGQRRLSGMLCMRKHEFRGGGGGLELRRGRGMGGGRNPGDKIKGHLMTLYTT